MGIDEVVLWVIGGALALVGIAAFALLAVWLPHFIDLLLHRDDEE